MYSLQWNDIKNVPNSELSGAIENVYIFTSFENRKSHTENVIYLFINRIVL